EAGTGKAFRDRPARRWRLHDLRAAPARELRPHMTDHPKLTRHVLEHLRDVLAERLQRAAALRARARHLVRDRLSRQVLWKGPTDRRGGRFGRLKIAALQRRELRFARLELLERQLKLRDPRIELLARATEPQPLQLRQLDLQLLDLDLAAQQQRLLLDHQTLQAL